MFLKTPWSRQPLFKHTDFDGCFGTFFFNEAFQCASLSGACDFSLFCRRKQTKRVSQHELLSVKVMVNMSMPNYAENFICIVGEALAVSDFPSGESV